MSEPTEKEIARGIINALRTLGASVYTTSQARASKITPGIPDLLVFFRGRFVFIEVKRPTGQLSVAQHEFRTECLKAHVPFYVWTSSEQAIEWARAAP